jgi:penicillin amidase
VVGGAHTQSGAALVAGDMHLGLRVPTVWYRARLQTTSGDPPELNGVTLPGVPAVVAGSNGHVAWSFTNSYGDWVDVRGYSCDPKSDLYYTSTGEQRFKVSRERIEVLRGDPVIEVVRESPLGVLVTREPVPGRSAGWRAGLRPSRVPRRSAAWICNGCALYPRHWPWCPRSVSRIRIC